MMRWRFLTILCGVSAVLGADAGTTGSTTRSIAADSLLVTVTGTVYDSIARALLQGAEVQLVARPESAEGRRFTARTDTAGRYRITGVPADEYVVTFSHGAVDSLGLKPDARPVRVAGTAQRVDLAIPSARTLRRVVCPQAVAADSTALLMGHVRQASVDMPLVGATVMVMWTEWTSLTGEIGSWQPRQRQVTAETTDEGWFALCDVPGNAPLLVRAAHGTNSSGLVRVTVPSGQLRHLTWYVGDAVRSGASTTSAPGTVSTATVWRGAARLTGRVRDKAGRPVPNAHANVWGAAGDRTTDTRGSFTLDSLPGGTQTLEVRAIGYAPASTVVHLAAGRPSNVDVTLGERVTELPKVTVREKESHGLKLRGFYERMEDVKRGINRGYFITPEEIESRKPPFITNMLDGIPAVYVERRGGRLNIPRGINRDPKNPLRRCEMAVFLDGQQILGGIRGSIDHPEGTTPDPIDVIAPAPHIAAVEVYPHPVTAPPQYQRLNGNCGIILLWTK